VSLEGGTVEYTDQQRATFKDVYARRFRGQLIMLGSLFAALGALSFTDNGRSIFGLSDNVLGPIALVVMVGAVVYSALNWRCPACGMGLGKGFNPRRCRRCGIELRGGGKPSGPKRNYR
jgi:hypothetical protein